jgi:hypothetical protein
MLEIVEDAEVKKQQNRDNFAPWHPQGAIPVPFITV